MDTRLDSSKFDDVLVTPVARLVQGGLKYFPDMQYGTDDQKVHSFGLKKGQPKFCYFLAVAIPKGESRIWKDTDWGQKIMQSVISQVGKERARKVEFTKIIDGDSPDNIGKPGFAGHWILRFKTTREDLQTFNRAGKLLDEQYIESFGPHRGDYIRIIGRIYVGEIKQTKSLLLYLTPTTVLFVKPGERIQDEKNGLSKTDALGLLLEGLPPEETEDTYPEILSKSLTVSQIGISEDDRWEKEMLSNFSLTKEGEKRADKIEDLLNLGFEIHELVKNGLVVDNTKIPF